MAKKKIKKESKNVALIKQLIAAFILNFALQYIIYQQVLGDMLIKYSTSFKVINPAVALIQLIVFVVAAVLSYNFIRGLGKPGAAGAMQLAFIVAGATYLPAYLARFIYEAGMPDFLKVSFFLGDTVQFVATYLLLDLIKKR